MSKTHTAAASNVVPSIDTSIQAIPYGEVLHFDRLARPYRWLEYLSFGPLLQRTRTHWLRAIDDRRNALVLGDGDGRFTAVMLTEHPRMHAHAVDVSAAMLRLLRDRCKKESNRIVTEQADLRVWAPEADEERYDLIVTHFFLDCLTSEEVANLAERLAPAVTPEAVWLVSEFAIPPTLYGRWIGAPIVAALYRAFGLLTGLRVRSLPDHLAALQHAGWQLDAVHYHAGGLLTSQLWKHAAKSVRG